MGFISPVVKGCRWNCPGETCSLDKIKHTLLPIHFVSESCAQWNYFNSILVGLYTALLTGLKGGRQLTWTAALIAAVSSFWAKNTRHGFHYNIVSYYLYVYLLLFYDDVITLQRNCLGVKKDTKVLTLRAFFVQYQSHINMQDGTFYLTLFATYKLLCGWDGSLFHEQNIREVFSQQNSSIAHTHSAKLESHFEVPTGKPFLNANQFLTSDKFLCQLIQLFS